MKLHELDDEWAWLRKRSATLDKEISELETEVMQVGCAKLCMLGSSLASPTPTLERVATLVSWVQLHLTEQGSVPHKDERDTLPDVRVFEGCPHPGLAGK